MCATPIRHCYSYERTIKVRHLFDTKFNVSMSSVAQTEIHSSEYSAIPTSEVKIALLPPGIDDSLCGTFVGGNGNILCGVYPSVSSIGMGSNEIKLKHGISGINLMNYDMLIKTILFKQFKNVFRRLRCEHLCEWLPKKTNEKLLFNDILFLHFFALLYTFFCGSPQRIASLMFNQFFSLDIGCAKGISISQFSFSPFCFALIVFVYRRFFVDRAYHHLLSFFYSLLQSTFAYILRSGNTRRH